MSTIKRTEFEYKKPNTQKDPKTGKWIGYKVDVRSRGRRYRDTFQTKKAAENFIDELRARTTYERAGLPIAAPGKDIMLSDLFKRRLAEIEHPRGRRLAERVFEYFEGLFDQPVKVTDVRRSHIQLYINQRLKDGIQRQTVNREINPLAAAINRAADMFPRELENFSPPPIARPKIDRRKRHRHVITEQEKSAIVSSIINDRIPRERDVRTRSRPLVAGVFEIGWLLGLRYSEIMGLNKKDSSRKNKSLRVTRKTGETITLSYLPDEAFEILDSAAAASSTKRIFDIPCSQNTLLDIIRRACEANGIIYGRSEPGGVTLHSTRHAFTTRLVQLTDIATAGEYTGHSNGVMVDYYSHSTEEQKRLAMEKMYGSRDGKDLRAVFEKVKEGEMSLKDFLEALN